VADIDEWEDDMVKGTHKQMVVIRTPGNVYYEQAYFVLRESRGTEEDSEESMMAEANRILDECHLMPQPRRHRRLPRVACFWLGVMVGGAVAGVLCLLALALL
jgi:hypothetical protein